MDDAKTAGAATAPISHLSSGEAAVIGVQDRNLLFACYPVRLARELLGLDTAWMARKFGYSEKEWRRIEANLLVLPLEMRGRIEDFVRASLAESCRV